MIKLRFQLWFWKALGQLAIGLRDSGQRCYAWYERYSPMKIVVSGVNPAKLIVVPDTTCPICGKSNCYYWKDEVTE